MVAIIIIIITLIWEYRSMGEFSGESRAEGRASSSQVPCMAYPDVGSLTLI